MKVLLCFSFLFLGLSAFGQHTNVLISSANEPNEPSICINPKNTKQLVAGANLDNVYYSQDGGLSWTQTPVSCPWGVWGDPVMGVDTTGAFYFLHLSNPPAPGSWIDRIIAQKSTDGGKSWSAGTYTGLNGTKAQDKHWIATDWKTNTLYVTWTQFDKYGSNAKTDSSVILFSKSTDGGQSWTAAKRINKLAGDCIDSDLTAEGAMPCVGPKGQVYVAWSNRNKIWFDRSLDGGATWLSEDVFVSDQPGGWDYQVPGIYRANGLPVTTCDTSGGPYNGTIYINWTDQRNGSTDTDVWLAKSTDGGNTWSTPVRVNNDGPGRQQFFTWMTIDQKTGRLWFVFYDRRNYTNNLTDVYMAVSEDGGLSFKNFKVSESAFLPSANVFFGDYTNVTAHNNIVRPIWARLSGSNLSVWTAIVKPELVTAAPEAEAGLPLVAVDAPYPNPSATAVDFSFKLRKPAVVHLSLVDLQSRECAVLINNVQLTPGRHTTLLTPTEFGLPAGTYFFVLRVDGKMERRKVVLF